MSKFKVGDLVIFHAPKSYESICYKCDSKLGVVIKTREWGLSKSGSYSTWYLIYSCYFPCIEVKKRGYGLCWRERDELELLEFHVPEWRPSEIYPEDLLP